MEKKRIYTGSNDFQEMIQSNYYYVDKTLLIKDLIDSGEKAVLFTRPRRFGKSININMLKVFFEINSDTADLFTELKIWQCGDKYKNKQGKYPVIYLSFLDFSATCWKTAYERLMERIIDEYNRHYAVLSNSTALNVFEKKDYCSILDRTATQGQYISSIYRLSSYLLRHYGVKPFIMIDEYDVPIQAAQANGYYDEMIAFLKGLYTGACKDNPNMEMGIMTGVLRVMKESIFSGMNNFMVYSVLDKDYNQYFGFTKAEVSEMAEYYGTEEDISVLKEWYDGYDIGGTEIYNPWSVVQYFKRDCVADAYWLDTSKNEIIHTMFDGISKEMLEDLARLVQGQPVTAIVQNAVSYPDLKKNQKLLYTMLVMTGYLKVVSKIEKQEDMRRRGQRKNIKHSVENKRYQCELVIPNAEIMEVYQTEILEYFQNHYKISLNDELYDAIWENDVAAVQAGLSKFLMESTSNFDRTYEVFYQGLMLGISHSLSDSYYILSNLESGEGRYDIQMEPKESRIPGIVMELKSMKEDFTTEEERDVRLLSEAREALMQIEKNKYTTNLRMHGVKDIILYGMAFNGKHVKVLSKVME